MHSQTWENTKLYYLYKRLSERRFIQNLSVPSRSINVRVNCSNIMNTHSLSHIWKLKIYNLSNVCLNQDVMFVSK